MSDRPGISITGAAMITSLGADRRATWSAIAAGRCGVGPMSALEQRPVPDKGGGQAVSIGARDEEGAGRAEIYLGRTIRDALNDAGLGSGLPCAPDRCAVVLGTTLAGLRHGGHYLRTRDPRHLRGIFAAETMRRALGDLPITGPSLTTSAACASGLSAIAQGITLLESGDADLVVAGGYDAISEFPYGGFNSLRLVAEGALAPFTRDRTGMKIGEGYALVVLERAADASARGATVVARIVGYGETSDAHHLTQPDPSGAGAARAVRAALARGGIAPDEIGLLSAHATATPNNDAAEHAAFSAVFGTARPPIVAFKSHLGHTLGGAGAVELVLAAMALEAKSAPPCANVAADDLEFDDLDVVTESPASITKPRAATFSLGFGGANASMVIAGTDAPEAPKVSQPPRRDVVITGIGVVAPGAIGLDAFLERLKNGDGDAASVEGGIDEATLADLVRTRRARRLSVFAKLLLAAATEAVRDARFDDDAEALEHAHVVVGTNHGATGYTEEYYRGIVEQGIDDANPMLFAESVPNVGSAQLSLMLGVHGTSQSIIGARTSGIDALQFAQRRIASGDWDRAVVGAADEHDATVDRAYTANGMPVIKGDGTGPGMRTACGAAVLVLEAGTVAAARNARVRGTVDGVTARRCPAESIQSFANVVESLITDAGAVDTLVAADTGSWLACIERVAGRRGGARRTRSIYGPVAESFAALPFMAVAASLLENRPDDGCVGVLSTDLGGGVALARITPTP